jgi:hypothetical protein
MNSLAARLRNAFAGPTRGANESTTASGAGPSSPQELSAGSPVHVTSGRPLLPLARGPREMMYGFLDEADLARLAGVSRQEHANVKSRCTPEEIETIRAYADLVRQWDEFQATETERRGAGRLKQAFQNVALSISKKKIQTGVDVFSERVHALVMARGSLELQVDAIALRVLVEARPSLRRLFKAIESFERGIDGPPARQRLLNAMKNPEVAGRCASYAAEFKKANDAGQLREMKFHAGRLKDHLTWELRHELMGSTLPR